MFRAFAGHQGGCNGGKHSFKSGSTSAPLAATLLSCPSNRDSVFLAGVKEIPPLQGSDAPRNQDASSSRGMLLFPVAHPSPGSPGSSLQPQVSAKPTGSREEPGPASGRDDGRRCRLERAGDEELPRWSGLEGPSPLGQLVVFSRCQGTLWQARVLQGVWMLRLVFAGRWGAAPHPGSRQQ